MARNQKQMVGSVIHFELLLEKSNFCKFFLEYFSKPSADAELNVTKPWILKRG